MYSGCGSRRTNERPYTFNRELKTQNKVTIHAIILLSVLSLLLRLSLVCLSALLLALTLPAAAPAQAAGVIYVRSAATGANDGTNWLNASRQLAKRADRRQQRRYDLGCGGTYKPTTTTDRSASFTLKNGVAVYGGFAGGETQLSARNWSSNVTTLSGDIGTASNTGDNSYHVVTGATDYATLDGFTITGGNA